MNIYYKAKFWLSNKEHHSISTNKFNTVHARLARKNKKGKTIVSLFDTVLVNQGNGKYPGVDGFRIA